jgi:hypothetical protein
VAQQCITFKYFQQENKGLWKGGAILLKKVLRGTVENQKKKSPFFLCPPFRFLPKAHKSIPLTTAGSKSKYELNNPTASSFIFGKADYLWVLVGRFWPVPMCSVKVTGVAVPW